MIKLKKTSWWKLLLYVFTMLLVTTGVLLWYIAQPLFITGKTNTSVLVDKEKLHKHVYKLSVDFFPRDHTHVANLDKAALYIKTELEKHSSHVRYQDYEVDGKRYRNVIAEFGPKSKSRIVVGAHYDATSTTPGADDNASGVAVLLEVAALLSREKSKSRIELVAYTLEEVPHFRTPYMGSYVHAHSLKKNNVDVSLMISLEMLGYFSDQPNSQKYPVPALKYLYSDTGNFVTVVSRFGQASVTRKFKRYLAMNTSVKVYSINAPATLPGIDFSDHASYWEVGYNAVMLTDTAFYRNYQYHLSGDTHDKLDYARMAAVATGVYRALVMLSSEKQESD